MSGMKDYLLWIQQQQLQKPEWQAARQWQNRNQTPIKEEPKKPKEDVKETQEDIDPSE